MWDDRILLRRDEHRDRSIAFLIFGFLLACYLLTYTGYIQSSDGLSMFATVESMVRRWEIDSNSLLWMGLQQGDFGQDGDLYSRKGLGMALLAHPLVWIAERWRIVGLVQAALLLNPLLTAWTGALLFRTGRRLGWTRNTAIAVALLFGLGTIAWPYTQTFFSDPLCAWGLYAAAYALLAFAQTGRKGYMAAAGTAWSLAYLARTLNLLTLPIYLVALALVLRSHIRRRRRTADEPLPGWVMLLRRNWRPLIAFLVPVALAGLISLWWNWARFGSPFATGYAETERFNAVWWFGVFGQLIGPARGLLWYSPILLLVLPGSFWFWRYERRIFGLSAAVIVLYVLAYGKWYMWHGGYSWGPRFLVPVVPFLALLAGGGWIEAVEWRRWGRAGRVLTFALLALSVGVQWLGMLTPFGLVQDWLAANVPPLFAAETFVKLEYSPLLLQWRTLTPEQIHLAWWRAGQLSGSFNWLGLLMPLSGVVAGAVLLVRQVRRGGQSDAVESPRNWLYGVALGIIALAILTYYLPYLSTLDQRAIADQIARLEKPGDAILHLVPEQTQQFANVYHGRLPTYGLPAGGELDAEDQRWLERLHADYLRLWVIPDGTSPEASGWERWLRMNDFVLLDSRPGGENGERLALYGLADGGYLTPSGLGTIFGAPEDAGAITAQNGWIRLAGYAVSEEVPQGGELLLALNWQSLRPVSYDYHVFVHLLDSEGSKLAQRDGRPVQWLRPISSWQPGEKVIDRYGLLLSDDFPPGTYTLAVGLYDPVSGQRLPISAGPENYALELGPIQVRAVH